MLPGVAAAKDCLGALHRERGDLAASERLHREALSVQAARLDRAVTGMNLGMTLCALGRWDEAVAAIRQSLDVCERNRRDRLAAFAHATLLWPLAALGQWEAFDHHLRGAEPLRRGEDAERDCLHALECATRLVPPGPRRDAVAALRKTQRDPRTPEPS